MSGWHDFVILLVICIAQSVVAIKSADEALHQQQEARVTGARLAVRIEFGYKGPWASSVKTPACSVLHATLRTLLSWRPSRLEVVFRDKMSRCELEPGGIVQILEKSPSHTAHVILRMGVGDTVLSQGGSLYNALLLLHDDVQSGPGEAFDWNTLPLSLSSRGDRKAMDTLFLCADEEGDASTSNSRSRAARNRIEFAYYDKVSETMPPATVKLPLSPSRGESFQDTSISNKEEDPFVVALNNTLVNGLLDAPWRSHVENNLQVLRNLSWTEYLSSRIKDGRMFQFQREGARKAAAVIVEPRVLPTLEYSIRSTMHHLLSALASPSTHIQWKFRVYHSVGAGGNENFLRRVLADVPPALIKFVPLPLSFGSGGNGGSYNQLFKSNQFWKPLSAHGFDAALIFQADSVVLDASKLASDFLHFDLVGAPWPVPKLNVWERAKFTDMCCNGGLSLRRVAPMLGITSKKRSLTPAVNEDKYFSGYAEEFKLRVPDRAQAEQFALEAPTSDKAMKPLGLHTAWAYNDLDVVTSLLEEGVASLLRKKEIKE